MSNAENVIAMLNTIRDNASQQYQDRIPEATRQNIEAVQAAFLDDGNVMAVNEFSHALLNTLVKQVIISKLFSNPLKMLKKGAKKLGDTVEEIYPNFLKAEVYDPSGSELLQRKLPDIKAVYHRMNRKDKYKVTISREMLAKAFSSYESLGTMVQNIINTLFNSSELDEFILTKQLLKIAVENNACKIVEVADPATGETNAKSFIKSVKKVSGKMAFPSADYNGYLTAQDTDTKELITFSRKNEQILILDTDTETDVNIDVLASIFNMSVAEFNDTRKIIIDHFPDPTMRAALVDEHFFQIYDDLVYFSTFRNEEGIYDNYYLHIWQTLSYSPLVNAVIFKVASDADDDGTVETFNVTNTLKSGVTSNNDATTISEGMPYSSRLTGVKSTDEVVVTMGGTDITTTAYKASSKRVTIPEAKGNIVVRVGKFFDVTNTLDSGVSNSNDATEAFETSKYEGTLSGIVAQTVTVTMGDEDITSTAYTAATGKISIASVTGDITITVA